MRAVSLKCKTIEICHRTDEHLHYRLEKVGLYGRSRYDAQGSQRGIRVCHVFAQQSMSALHNFAMVFRQARPASIGLGGMSEYQAAAQSI